MSVWNTLAAIDCNQHTEKKGKFTYLSWTWAWAMVKERYPDADYHLEDDLIFPDGTMEVRVSVSIDGMTHTMWLPVLGFKNDAIQNPNAFDINSSRMRCLVKCLAMFGLGHYIYAGDSMPSVPSFTTAQKETFIAILANGDGFALKAFGRDVGEEVMNALFNDAPQGQKTRLKNEVRDLVGEANALLKTTLTAIEEALVAPSADTLREIFDELTPVERGFVDSGLTETQHHQIKELVSVE